MKKEPEIQLLDARMALHQIVDAMTQEQKMEMLRRHLAKHKARILAQSKTDGVAPKKT